MDDVVSRYRAASGGNDIGALVELLEPDAPVIGTRLARHPAVILRALRPAP